MKIEHVHVAIPNELIKSTYWNEDHKITDAPTGYVPIGGIIPWLKNYANTPALPEQFVECNGQVLSDAESVYNGQTIPNLNGNNYFLRGNATSGTTGGASSTSTNLKTTSYQPGFGQSYNVGTALSGGGQLAAFFGTGGITCYNRQSFTDNFSTIPPYYNIVWVMRIK